MTPRPPPPSGKLTVVFTDIEKSSRGTAALGDAKYHTAMHEPHSQRIRAAMAVYRGHEIKTRGDGFQIVFERADEVLACAVHIPKSLVQPPITVTDTRDESGFAPVGSAPGAVPARVATLADGVLKGTTWSPLKVVAALVMATGMVAGGTGWLLLQGSGAQPPSAERLVLPALRAAGADFSNPEARPQARTDRFGDLLPPGARLRLGTVRLRHGGQGGGLVTFAADGRTLISVHADGVVHFWETATGKELRRVTTGFVFFGGGAVAVLADTQLLALPSGNVITLWDLASGKRRHSLLGGRGNLVRSFAFAPDGRTAATGDGGCVQLWEVTTGKELRQFQAGVEPVAVAFAPGGKALAAKTPDGKGFVWDAATGKELWRFAGTPGSQADLAWLTDGKALAAAKDGSVVLWDAATGRQLRRLEGHKTGVGALACSRDGQTLASSGSHLRLWEVATGRVLRDIDLAEGYAGCLAFSPDGKTLAAAGSGSRVRLWDTRTGTELQVRPAHEKEIHAVAFSPDGKVLATADGGFRDSSIRFWDPTTGQEVGSCRGLGSGGDRLLFSPDGRSLFACGAADSIREWDVAAGLLRRRLRVHPNAPRTNQVATLALSPGGTTLTAVSRNLAGRSVTRVLAGWDLATGEQVLQRQDLVDDAFNVTLSADGRLLASPNGPTVQVRDVATGKEFAELHGRCAAVWGIAFAPDGRTLAGLCYHRVADARFLEPLPRYTLCIWELATGQELCRANLPGRVMSFTFSCDGRVLASGGEQGVPIQLWDVVTGKELGKFEGHDTDVTCLAFSPNGDRLASGLRDSTTLVWDVTPAARRTRGGARDLSPDGLERLWSALADPDGAKAHRALWDLVAAPEHTVNLFKARLRPAAAAEPGLVARLIADLDSSKFASREAAFRRLEELGAQAGPAVRQALQGKPSAEARRRLEALLTSARTVRAPEALRRIRAAQALERIGTPEARKLLETLAQGAPAARETEDAKASLERLAGQVAVTP